MLDTPFESPEYVTYLSPIFPDVYVGFLDIRHTTIAVPRLELVINNSGSASLKPRPPCGYEMEQYLAFSSSDDEKNDIVIPSTLYDNPTTLTYSALFHPPLSAETSSCNSMQDAMLGEYRHFARSKVVEDLIPGHRNSLNGPNSLTINPSRLNRKPFCYSKSYGGPLLQEEDERMEDETLDESVEKAEDRGKEDRGKKPSTKKRRTRTAEKIAHMMYKSPSKRDPPLLISRQFPFRHDETNRVSQMMGRQGIIDNPKRRMKCCCDSFKSYYDFAEHLDAKHDPLFRPWVCPDETCPWSVLGFFTLSDCTRHFCATHSQKSYVCKECAHLGRSRRFGRADALRRHVVENHVRNK